MTSKTQLCTRVAMGLTVKLFDCSPTLRDVSLLAQGRVNLWPGWGDAEPQARQLVARFLGHRPDELAEDRPLLDQLRGALSAEADFRVGGQDNTDQADWSDRYQVVPGAAMDDRLAAWLLELDMHGRRPASAGQQVLNGRRDLELVGAGLSFRVPAAHLPPPDPVPHALRTAAPTESIRLVPETLQELASAVDRGLGGETRLYSQIAVGQFLRRLRGTDGKPVGELYPGPTQLAVAPTGSGKSVFARLLALQLAGAGQCVALVVPDVQTVWKEVLRLREAADAAGLAMSIAPLSSWRNTASRLGSHLDQPPKEDPDGLWALRTLGYSCQLSAYQTTAGDSSPPGQEPCTRLRRHEPGRSRDAKVDCPFRESCGRFDAFNAALSADIIVVNHHAFLAGRVPAEVVVDGGPPRKISTAELVLRRATAVFIDEIDALQSSAIGANSRGLMLSSRGSLSKPIQLYTEVERRRAENRLGREVRFERGRSALLRIMSKAELLSELINRDELDWPERGLTWREAHDSWLAERLYGHVTKGLERVRSLFESRAITESGDSEALRVALLPLGPGQGDGTLMEEVRADIMVVLRHWQLQGTRRSNLDRERHKVANQLILRAALIELDGALGHLRPQLHGLEQLDVRHAGAVRDDLLGYAPWQPSPAGPLGRRLYGYTFAKRAGEQGALESRVMAGDPHGLMRDLGGLVSHALAGAPRVVVGFSATARFRGSPRADVLGDLTALVPDRSRNVRVLEATVQARISGTGSRADRLQAAADAASELWQAMLSHYLRDRLESPETEDRARALLVTGSYDEAAAVARGLRTSSEGGVTVRYLVRDAASTKEDPDAIHRSQIESFGGLPGPAVLVGPLSVVSRGHNILQPDSQLSALAGIFVLTRPVPPSHDADRLLAHLAYNALLFPTAWRGTPGETVEAERRDAWRRLRALQRSPAVFRRMDPVLRRELICDVLVELAQLAGRARRGGTSVDLVFVDGAFQDEVVPWSGLVLDVLEWWREQGWLAEMTELHGGFVAGLAAYVGMTLTPSGRSS